MELWPVLSLEGPLALSQNPVYMPLAWALSLVLSLAVPVVLPSLISWAID